MTSLAWILGSGLLMALIALVGSVTLLLPQRVLERMLLPLVAFAAGSLIGGAFLHMLPAAQGAGLGSFETGLAVIAGFTVFFGLEQFLHWHHCQRAARACRQPVTYLILIGDGLHNLLGGFAIGGIFLVDIRLGLTAWLAAAAHEVPQELGDFGVLVHGGWSRRSALLFNLVSGLTFPLGGVAAWLLSHQCDVSLLIPFAAGNFIYIGASDLVPEVHRRAETSTHLGTFAAFAAGVGVLLVVGYAID